MTATEKAITFERDEWRCTLQIKRVPLSRHGVFGHDCITATPADLAACGYIPAELAGREAAGQGDWVDLLSAARDMLNAVLIVYPGRTREEVERDAYQRLEAAVNAFPHPCAAAGAPSKPPERAK
jgi:hypothetical protein